MRAFYLLEDWERISECERMGCSTAFPDMAAVMTQFATLHRDLTEAESMAMPPGSKCRVVRFPYHSRSGVRSL